ncbi:hypothetical protein C8Q80DRAFT_1270045 [Daedaleopsis nitida]|nr:hypothetical protein C8Q80DRAFT_1270045 [Daedaleopsis nitida]
MAYKQDQELWFDTGFVVLVADDETAFRIPKYLLTRVSPVFESMFRDAHPGEMEDGCPVVRLAHDRSADLRHFLRFLTEDKIESLTKNYPFSTLAAILRIAHKYEAVEIVEAAYPRIEDAFVYHVQPRWYRYSKAGIDFKPEDAFEFVNLARLVNKPLPPAALFLCYACGLAKLRDGVARADGYIERLSEEDFERCIHAIPRLSEAYRQCIVKTYDVTRVRTFRDCNRDDRCKKQVQTLLEARRQAWANAEGIPNLAAMIVTEGPEEKSLCPSCKGWLSDWGNECCDDARSPERLAWCFFLDSGDGQPSA